jgi:hypothetical protein
MGVPRLRDITGFYWKGRMKPLFIRGDIAVSPANLLSDLHIIWKRG